MITEKLIFPGLFRVAQEVQTYYYLDLLCVCGGKTFTRKKMNKRSYSQVSDSEGSSQIGIQALLSYNTPSSPINSSMNLDYPDLMGSTASNTLTFTQFVDPDWHSRQSFLKWLVKPSRVYSSSPLIK